MNIAIGDVLDGKYEITETLGEGAMGVVYVARHKRLQRTVALKTLRSEYAANAELIGRFEREARAASAIGHPNIVQVFDAGGDLGGTPYLVMEYLEGQSLGDLLHEAGPLSIERSIDICAQVLAGLGAAHSVGILHRDLKPDNIFVTKDSEGHELVKILDFGISKVLDVADPSIAGDARATRVGMVLGTPLYMSPEQASGRLDLDLRTDLWSAVCVLYECLTGKTPFNGDNYNQILAAVTQGIFVGVREHRPEISLVLHELVQRGLKVERDDRFPDATSLSVALTSIQSEPNDSTEPDDEPQMLAAFDNLADRFMEQEREDAAGTKAPAPGIGAPVSAPQSARPPALDPFAPPDSQVVLTLDLETDPLAPGPRDSIERHISAPRPKKRAPSQIVTRKQSSGVASFVGKSLLLLLLVAGAGAAYRYHKLGYVLPQQAPPAVQLVLDLEPDATFYVDEMPRAERRLELKGGKTYTLGLSAAFRLEMLGTVQTHAGDKIRVSQVMWYQILPIDSEVVSEVRDLQTEPATSESQRANREKIEAYGDCGTRLTRAITRVLDEKDLEPLPRQLTDECIATFDLAIAQEPRMEDLDGISARYRGSLADFAEAMVEQKRSKGGSAKLRRDRAEEAQAAARAMKKSAALWLETMSGVQARWHQSELSRATQSSEDPLHAEVRSLAVASDAWMRTHLAGKAAKKQRARMAEQFALLSKSAGQRSDELKERGVTGYLNSLRPLIDNEPGEDALFWHNQSVEMFNKIRLPLLIAVDSADQDSADQ